MCNAVRLPLAPSPSLLVLITYRAREVGHLAGGIAALIRSPGEHPVWDSIGGRPDERILYVTYL